MNLYFLRHGKAEEHSAAKADSERHLVAQGLADAGFVASLLKRLALPLDAIYTSPYPRASETAQVVASFLEASAVLSERLELEAGRFGMGSLQKLTRAHRANAHLLLVGHEPDLSETIRLLCGAECEMKTAGIAFISADRVEPGQGVLHWLLTPKLLSTQR